MEILRAQAGASAASVLQFLEYSTAKENMGETVFVLSYTDDFSMSNAVFEQVAETFEASALYNGPPFRAAQIVRGDGGVQDEVAAARGVEQNLVQIWKRGSLIKEVDTFGLETALLAEGLRCAKYPTNTGSGAGGMRERKKTDAADLANAVDDIDFTGGVAGAGGTTLVYITHHYEEVLPSVTHVMHLSGGDAVFVGPRAAYEESGLLG